MARLLEYQRFPSLFRRSSGHAFGNFYRGYGGRDGNQNARCWNSQGTAVRGRIRPGSTLEMLAPVRRCEAIISGSGAPRAESQLRTWTQPARVPGPTPEHVPCHPRWMVIPLMLMDFVSPGPRQAPQSLPNLLSVAPSPRPSPAPEIASVANVATEHANHWAMRSKIFDSIFAHRPDLSSMALINADNLAPQ